MHPMPASFLPFFLLAPAMDGWLGIYLDTNREEAVVVETVPDSPAARAGIEAGDVLLAVGEQATPTREQFIAAIRARKPRERVTVVLRRDGQRHSVVVQLGERPEELPAPHPVEVAPVRPRSPVPSAEPAPAPARSPATAPEPARGYLGVSVRESERGVVVDQVLPDGPAAGAGVREGDVVTSIDEQRVDALADLDGALRGAPAGRKVVLGLRGDAGTRSVSLTLGRRPAEARASAPASPSEAPRPARSAAELDAEIAAMRAELAELRRQIEALRRDQGRE